MTITSIRALIRTVVDGIASKAGVLKLYAPGSRGELSLKAASRLKGALDRISTPIMLVDGSSSVTYANDAARKLLTAYRDNLRSVWPDFTGEIVGSHIDIPANAAGLPSRASITAGALQFCLSSTAIFDLQETYLGNVLEWTNISETRKLDPDGEAAAGGDAVDTLGDGLPAPVNTVREDVRLIQQNAKSISESAERLMGMSRQLLAHAEATAGEAEEIAAASDEVSGSVSIMESGGDKMMASIREIAESSVESARVAQSAVAMAESANQTISKLGASSREIGKVVDVIASIGRQTNLLALNASIEAGRAGEAGRGFAVVAKEVQALSKETAKAIANVGAQIAAIRSDSKGAMQAIGEIQSIVVHMSDLVNSIAVSIEQQTATTNQMGHNVKGASRGAADIASHITGVAVAAQNTTEGANETLQAAKNLAGLAAEIEVLAGRLKIQ